MEKIINVCFLSFAFIQLSLTKECRFSFSREPVSTLPCNPYLHDMLTTSCSVIAHLEDDSFILSWYFTSERNQLSNQDPTLLRNTMKYQFRRTSGIFIDDNEDQSRLVEKSASLTITDLDDADVGRYFCQIQLANGSKLEPSNAIELTAQDAYLRWDLPSCREFQLFQRSEKCVLFLKDACRFRIQREPLPNLTCNPFCDNNMIMTTCSFTAPLEDEPFRVSWYVNSSSAGDDGPMLLDNYDKYAFQGLSGILRDGNETYVSRSESLFILNLTDSDAGQYYCQIELANGTKLEPSSALQIHTEDVYIESDFPFCDEVEQSRTANKCVRVIIPTTDATTTTESTSQPAGSDSSTAIILVTTITGVALVILISCSVLAICTGVLFYRKKKTESAHNGHTNPTSAAQLEESIQLHPNPGYGRRNGYNASTQSAATGGDTIVMERNPTYNMANGNSNLHSDDNESFAEYDYVDGREAMFDTVSDMYEIID